MADQDMVFHEKSDRDQVEIALSDVSVEDGNFGFQYDRHMDRKVVLGLDLLLLPVMSVIFVLLFLDRANVGNARVAGLQKDLGLTDYQYQTSLMVTYIPYILIEIPSNLALKKISPRIMLPGLCMAWGVVTTFESLMQNYSGFLACRFFLGLCEGGLFPGFVLYLSDFYRRDELQRRIGVIYGAAAVSGAFSGLLAAAIEMMQGVGGLHGWRWIFILEGIFTVVFGFFSLWILPNTPQNVLLFTVEQKEYCMSRLIADAKAHHSDKISRAAILSAFKEPHILNIAVVSFCLGVVIGGLAYFIPSIVAALGFNTTDTQLLSVPPYVFAFIFTMIAATIADRYHMRGIVSLSMISIGIIGCILNLTGTSVAVRYTSLCLMVSSIYSTAPTILTWIPNNSATYGKRATAVAIGFVTSNCGGIIAAWLYPTSDAPRYLFASRFNLSLLLIMMALTTVQIFLLRHLNTKKVEKREELLHGIEHLSLDEQMNVLRDHHPDYKYTL